MMSKRDTPRARRKAGFLGAVLFALAAIIVAAVFVGTAPHVSEHPAGQVATFSITPAGTNAATAQGYVEFYYMLDPISGGHWCVNANDTDTTISLNGFSGYVEISTDSDRVFFEGIPRTMPATCTFTTNVSRMKFGQYPRGDTHENITFSATTSLGVKTFEYTLLVRCLLPGSPDFGIGGFP